MNLHLSAGLGAYAIAGAIATHGSMEKKEIGGILNQVRLGSASVLSGDLETTGAQTIVTADGKRLKISKVYTKRGVFSGYEMTEI